MIDTRIYDEKDLEKESVQKDIKETLLNGKNVVFPTETVYGIGANALNLDGVKNIYRVKGRPSDNPLIMHIASVKDFYRYSKNHQAYVEDLIKAFWPGPLTLVVEKVDQVPQAITGGLNTVGMRWPSSTIAQKVIEIAGVPICAPSANISGRPSSTLFEHVLDDFNHKVDILIDGGKTQVGLESTVLDVTQDKPIILRPGMITKKMIENITGEVIISSHLSKTDIPKAPGMKYRHYAPKADMMIVEGDMEKVVHYINQKIAYHRDKKTAVICTNDLLDQFHADIVYSIGDVSDAKEIASNVFVALREMDKQEVDVIYSIAFNQSDYGETIMNRLMKAANHQIIHLQS